jgi:hypothetical protein
MHEQITEENFLRYCAKHYDGGLLATVEDFKDDLSKIKYIKKLITRYRMNGILKERLILNHIIVLNNMFGANVTPRMLFFKLSSDFDVIKPMLVSINIMPDMFRYIGEYDTVLAESIPIDMDVHRALERI